MYVCIYILYIYIYLFALACDCVVRVVCRAMTEEEFMEKMHVYVDLKLKERGSLYDVAANIFHQ